MPRMTGGQALVEMLRAEGVKYVFGNPGTTEVPFTDTLQDVHDIQYVTALYEGVAVGMADGYARAAGKPSFVNLHITVGLANGIAVLYNSWRGGTPMVITAGQADTSLHLHSPVLYSNMVNVMREYTKWAGEISHAGDVPAILRRAFKVARTPPTGPVFLSLPWNATTQEADVEIVPSVADYFRVRPDAGAVARAAKLLARAQNPLVLIGDRVAQSPGAPLAVARVVEQMGAPVYATSFSEVNISTSHPQYMGSIYTSWIAPRYKRLFDDADAILAVGTDLLSQLIPTPDPLFTDAAKIVHLDCSDWEIQRSYPVGVGVLADIKAGLEDLSGALDDAMSGEAKEAARLRAAAVAEDKQSKQERFQRRARERWDQVPISPERLMLEIKDALPEGAIVVDDSISSRGALQGAMDFERPGDMFGFRGGSLGWGVPGALGVKLAAPGRPVVAVVGDGTAMYTFQALWTAAMFNLPVTYVVCNNRSYKVLKQAMDRYLATSSRESQYIGMDFHEKPLDFVKLAGAFGVEGIRVERPEELGPALRKALDSGATTVVDVNLDPTVDTPRLREEWGAWYTGRR